MSQGASFLYSFDLGNRDPITPGSKILSVTSTADGDFDKANLTTESLRHVWRSADAISWQEIIIEADQESHIDTFAILGHNFTAGAVVQLQANIADNWLAPPVTVTIPWARRNMIWTNPLGGTFRYYRVRILDPANPCGYIQIGRIVGGRAVIMENNEDVTDEVSFQTEDKADKMESEGFFQVSNENVKVKTPSIRFAKLKTTAGENQNYVALMDMLDEVGTTRPLLFVLDRGEPAFVNAWGQITRLPEISFGINRYASFSLSIREMF